MRLNNTLGLLFAPLKKKKDFGYSQTLFAELLSTMTSHKTIAPSLQ